MTRRNLRKSSRLGPALHRLSKQPENSKRKASGRALTVGGASKGEVREKMTLVLNDEDVVQLVSMPSCIDALEEAFRDIALGTAVYAPRRDSFMLGGRGDAYYSFKTIEGGLERLGVMAQRINSDLVTHPTISGGIRRVKVPAAPGRRYVGLIFLYSSETLELSLIHISEPTRRTPISYAVFCLKKKK